MAEDKKKEISEEDSMEDILHSIRDIIADEEEDGDPKEADSEENSARDEEEEVLDLTEVAEEITEEEGGDVLDEIDEALKDDEKTQEKPAEEKPAEEEAVKEEAPKEEAPKEEAPAPAKEAPIKQPVDSDKLVAETTAQASTAVMKELVSKIPGPEIEHKEFRSGNTVEDLVVETLKPMLKEWLDNNLEPLVRDIVEHEIRKLLPRE